MVVPKRLFKFLPSEYVEDAVQKGRLLFRNFTYFRQTEGRTRGDYLEAHHRDNPKRGITITQLRTGQSRTGDYSFLNSTDSDQIFMFCLSKVHVDSLYDEFEADACIEIADVGEFVRRVRVAVRRLLKVHKLGLIDGEVEYYDPASPAGVDIKDATVLPLLKDNIYSHQREYRLVYGRSEAFKLEQRLVSNENYDFKAAARAGTPRAKFVEIGSIRDLVKVHRVATRG
jgi:hypothetical protein